MCEVEQRPVSEIKISMETPLVVFVDFERLIANVDKAACDKLREYFPNQTREFEEPDVRQNFEIAKDLPSKLQQKLEKINIESGLFANVSPFPNALNALHQMKSFGFNIKIVMNHNLIGEKVTWIATKLGADWPERIIVINDRALLKGDYFIDTIASSTQTDVSWKRAIVDTSYNKSTNFGNVVRMSSLVDWKKLIEDKYHTLDNDIPMSEGSKDASAAEYIACFRHGSQDSRDIDVLYQFEKMPDNESILNFERGSGDEDRNIFTIDSNRGVVKECHRGIPDEVNNALLATYPLHEQKFPLPIRRKLPRMVVARTAVCLRVILITLRRVESIREQVIKALNSNSLRERGKILYGINLTTLSEDLDKDEWKLIAFHLGQTFWLIQGTEIYTKKELMAKSFLLKRFLYREEEKYSARFLQCLEQLKMDIVAEINDLGTTVKKDNLNMFIGDEEARNNNFFWGQSTGLIIDIRTERTVFFAYADPTLNINCSWPTLDSHPMLTTLMNLEMNYIGVFEYEGECWVCSPSQKIIQKNVPPVKNLELTKYWYVYAHKSTKKGKKIEFGELLAVIDRVTLTFVEEKTFKEQLERQK